MPTQRTFRDSTVGVSLSLKQTTNEVFKAGRAHHQNLADHWQRKIDGLFVTG